MKKISKTKKIVEIIERNGYITYERAMKISGWDIGHLHGNFRKSTLERYKLDKGKSYNGKKIITLKNKTTALRTIVSHRKQIRIDLAKEITGWHAGIVSGVLNRSNMTKIGENIYKWM